MIFLIHTSALTNIGKYRKKFCKKVIGIPLTHYSKEMNYLYHTLAFREPYLINPIALFLHC